jgi:translation initiation factor IF-2
MPDPVPVRDLAAAIGRKPFQIIADLMEIGLFKNVRETVAFDDASKIARKYGFEAQELG